MQLVGQIHESPAHPVGRSCASKADDEKTAWGEFSSIIAEAIGDGRVGMQGMNVLDFRALSVKQFLNSKVYGIKLKTPEKYNITKSSDDGHILFTSQYFIGQSDEVEAIIKYHINKNKADSCTHTE